MSVLPDLSIRSRLSLAFGIAFALTIVLGAFELSQLRAVNRVAVDVRDTWLPRVELLGELKRAVSQHRSLALRQLQTTNFRYLLEIATTTSATADAIDAASADYARVIRLPAERQLLERFVEQWARYREINARLLEYLQVGDVTTAFSEFDQSKAAFQAATARLDDLVAFAKERSQQQVERAQSIYERAWYLTLAAVVACALCTGLTAVWTGRQVSAPLRRITAAMRRLTEGDLDVRLEERPRGDEIGTLVSAVSGYRDSLLRGRELALEAERERHRLQAAVSNMPLGLCMYDREHRLIICNSRFAEMYALPADCLRTGTPLRQVLAAHARATHVTASEQRSYLEAFLAGLEPSLASRTLTLNVHHLPDGRVFHVAHQPLAEGGFVAVHEDVTERLRVEAQIVHLASHDALTGLPNRSRFHERVREVLLRVQRGETVAILFIDLDRFKSVNDTLGHPIGDMLLKRAAERLRRAVRETDTVARLGGDEFAIIAAGADLPVGATVLAQRIIDTVGAPYEIEGHNIVIGTSIGIAFAPADGNEPDELLKRADLALYRAKSDGRGVYRLFREEMDELMQIRRAMELDFRRGLRQGEFELWYQPIIDLGSSRISRFEALLRWRHPSRGLVSPPEFIPLAEEIGAIVSLGDWVVQQACRDATGWPEHIRLAINVSPSQFRSPDLVSSITNALQATGLPACRLELEISETVLLVESRANREKLQQLHDLGVTIALDDFGTGSSSLSFLKSFPFDKIKVDRSFITGLAPQGGDTLVFLRAIACLGSGLGIATTAEGVETEAQLDWVRAEGCAEGQGYLFSPPVPAGEVNRLLATVPSPPAGG